MRRRRRRPAAAALLAAVLAIGGCAEKSGDQPARSADRGVPGAASVGKRFGGIPQRGPSLGSPRAPYTMVEFVDLQCPYCAKFSRDVLPAVIERFVRPGRLRLELRPVRLLGPGSAPAGAATVAAGVQNRMWQFADVFFHNQRAENSGYVTEAFVNHLAAAVGLDAARLRRDAFSPRVRATLEANERSAQTARIYGTPNFRVGRTGGVLLRFDGRQLERRDFVRRLAAALR